MQEAIVGKLLRGHFKIISPLGGGGGGDTFVAVDIDRPGHPKCVVKRFKPPQNAPNLLLSARTLFNREAETLERLGQMHDQIPRLLAHFEEEEEFYLVQDFIEGHPLSVELPSRHRWSEIKVIQLLKDVLTTLEFVHSQDVIHRDVKPANLIRRRKDNKLVLIDFGAVKQVRGDTQASTQSRIINPTTISIGTQGYMPSEQAAGKPYLSSDIYALGMIGIQALTGTEPAHLQVDEYSEVIWQHKAQVSEQLASVLSKMVRYYFKERYQSATEALQALQDCVTQGDAKETIALDSLGLKKNYSEPNSSQNLESSPVIPQLQPHGLLADQQVDPTAVNGGTDDVSSEQKPDVQISLQGLNNRSIELGDTERVTEPQPEETEADLATEPSSSVTTESPIHSSINVEIPETKYSQPERSQQLPEIPGTRYSQPERSHSPEIPETKYSQPERSHSPEIPETKYGQPERAQLSRAIPETKYSQPERAISAPGISETRYSQPEPAQPNLEIPETKYSQPERPQPNREILETKYSQPERTHPTPQTPETRYSPASGHNIIPSEIAQNNRKLLIALGAMALVVIAGTALYGGQVIWQRAYTLTANRSPELPPSPETPKATPSPELKGDYTQLKTYLNKQPKPNWEAADQETYEIMLEVAGPKSKSKGFFDLEEWKEFPCEDFREIDRLWSEASQDELGFSAQTRILDQINDQIKYFSEIGWKQGQEKLVSLSISKNTNRVIYKRKPNFAAPPPGHLPARLLWSNQEDKRFEKLRECER